MITYIRKSIKGYYVEYPEEIDPIYWEGKIGSTYEDFRNNKWIRLSDEQVTFHKEHPGASISQVITMELPPELKPYERTIEDAKREKIYQIQNYDSSDAVNGFNVNGSPAGWITPVERSNYKNSIEAAEMIKLDTVSLYIQDNLVTLPIENAKVMLAQIQLYADACYLTTKQHIKNVEELETIEEVDNYNFESDYPEKLNFTL